MNIEALAREACEAASLPAAISAYPGVKDAMRRFADLVLEKAAQKCDCYSSGGQEWGDVAAVELAREIRALKTAPGSPASPEEKP
jgi:hypothetical protein